MNTEASESIDPTGDHTDTDEVREGSQESQSSAQKQSPVRIAAYLGFGVLAVYLGTWIGPLAFHVNFQGKMLAAREEVPGLVIWTRPEEVPPTRDEGWTFRKEGDVFIPVPPGSPKFTREDEAVVATFDESVITYNRFPSGFVTGILRKEGEVVGVTVDTSLSDVEVLRELLDETCDNYEIGWSYSRRALYTARILSKMLLWEEKPLRHFRFASRDGALAVLTSFEDDTATVIVAEDSGTLVVRLPADGPDGWKSSPSNWLPRAD